MSLIDRFMPCNNCRIVSVTGDAIQNIKYRGLPGPQCICATAKTHQLSTLYLARVLISTQVCSAALSVLPPGVLQRDRWIKLVLVIIRGRRRRKRGITIITIF